MSEGGKWALALIRSQMLHRQGRKALSLQTALCKNSGSFCSIKSCTSTIRNLQTRANYKMTVMLKLKLQYFGPLMWRTDSLEKTLMLGKIEDRRRKGGDRGWDGWMASLTRWTWVWVSSGSWWWTERPGVLQSMGSQRAGHDWATELNYYPTSYRDTNPIFKKNLDCFSTKISLFKKKIILFIWLCWVFAAARAFL